MGLESAAKIAAAYSIVAPERVFTIVESGAEQMNKHINAGIRLDEFYEYGAIEAGELHYDRMERQLLLHIPNSIALLENLARADLERTTKLADRFERPEIRRLARLRLVQALLDQDAAEKEKRMREQFKAE